MNESKVTSKPESAEPEKPINALANQLNELTNISPTMSRDRPIKERHDRILSLMGSLLTDFENRITRIEQEIFD